MIKVIKNIFIAALLFLVAIEYWAWYENPRWTMNGSYSFNILNKKLGLAPGLPAYKPGDNWYGNVDKLQMFVTTYEDRWPKPFLLTMVIQAPLLLESKDPKYIHEFILALKQRDEHLPDLECVKRLDLKKSHIYHIFAFDYEKRRYAYYEAYPCPHKDKIYLAMTEGGSGPIHFSPYIADFLKGTPAEIK